MRTAPMAGAVAVVGQGGRRCRRRRGSLSMNDPWRGAFLRTP
jgi:hypothetical protein